LSKNTAISKDHVKNLVTVLPGYCIEDAARGLRALTAARQSLTKIADKETVLLGATHELVHAWLVKLACCSWNKALPTTNTTYKCLEMYHFPRRDDVLLGKSHPVAIFPKGRRPFGKKPENILAPKGRRPFARKKKTPLIAPFMELPLKGRDPFAENGPSGNLAGTPHHTHTAHAHTQ
jgi:hypothetical protein